MLIGADPEVFVRRRAHFISAHIFPVGSKNKPTETKHGFVQIDGTALEFNTRPVDSRGAFLSGVLGCLDDCRLVVANMGCDIAIRPSVDFGLRYLRSLPRHASELGCNPDWNAYTKNTNPSPNENLSFRTGSGHVHIGWTQNASPRSVGHFNKCVALVKNLDILLGLPSLGWDGDIRRRELYGRAGAFRPKSYGLEYRVPSNAWLREASTINQVYDAVLRAFEMTRQGQHLSEAFPFAPDLINNNVRNWIEAHPDLAEEVLK